MAEESLVVRLKGDTADLDKKLSSTNKELDQLDGSVAKSEKGLGKMKSAAGLAGTAVVGLSKAAIAVGTALTTMITLSAKSSRELGVMATKAKTTTADFQALSFATKQFGVDAEGTADAMNDVIERLGEFSVGQGAGAFDDFALAMGLTTTEAIALADELKDLSGSDALRELVRQMEDAGVSGADMTFVLKSLSNDIEQLTPLYINQGKALDDLEKRYTDVASQMSLTQTEAKQLQTTATDFDLMVSALGDGAKLISAQLAPAMSEFFNGIISVVPDATQVIVDFINSFRDAEAIESLDSLNRLIDDQTVSISALKKQKDEYVGISVGVFTADQNEAIVKARLSGEIFEETTRLDELLEKKKEVEEQNKIEEARRLKGGEITANLGDGVGGGEELQAIIDRFKSEEELLAEKLANELVIAGENNELKLQLEQEFQDNIAAIRNEAIFNEMKADQEKSEAADKIREDAKKSARQEANDERRANKDKQKSDEAYLDAALAVGDALFEDNKAVRAGMVVADAGAGIMRAFADLPYPAALAASIGIAATGATQLAAVNSASKGGGSVTAPTPADIPEVEETDEFVTTSSDASGSNQSIVIRFESGGNDELAAALNGIMNTARTSGVIS